MQLTDQHRIAILLHDGVQGVQGKTGLSILRYSDRPIVAVIDRQSAGGDLPALTGIQRPVPIVASTLESLPYQPNVLMIGIAPSGGALPPAWKEEVKQAIAAGLSVVNGLHTPMATDPELKDLVQPGQWIWDVRQEPAGLTVGSGQARLLPCLRVLTVGTDMAVGKMSTSLELHKTAQRQGWRSTFIATGQTGLMLGEDGVALDAVRVDFAAGAVERLLMKYGETCDLIQVEGQGSVFNPASTATLPLLRGSQPTHLILVHRAGQTHIRNCPHVLIPPLPEVVQIYETIAGAGGAFWPTPVAAIALNTRDLDDLEAREAIAQVQADTGLPCTDPIRYGAAPLLAAIGPPGTPDKPLR